MSASKFKFISPGVFLEEIDQSRLPRLPDVMGPLIIGTADQGPAFQPVKVASIAEFIRVFGQPSSGSASDDPSRYGVQSLGVDYGAWAARAYLRNNSPLTFVRVLGSEHPNRGATGSAGWNIAAATANGDPAAGAYALYVSAMDGLDSLELPVRQNVDGEQAHEVTIALPAAETLNYAQDTISVVLSGAAIGDDELVITSANIAAEDLQAADAATLAARRSTIIGALKTALDAGLPGGFSTAVDVADPNSTNLTITGPATGAQFKVIAVDEPALHRNATVTTAQEGRTEATLPTADIPFLTFTPDGGAAINVSASAGQLTTLQNRSSASMASLLAGIVNSTAGMGDHLVASSDDDGNLVLEPKAASGAFVIKQGNAGQGGILFNLSSQLTSEAGQALVDEVAAQQRFTVTLAAGGTQSDAMLAAILHARTGVNLKIAATQTGEAQSNAGMFTLTSTLDGAAEESVEFCLDYTKNKFMRSHLETNPTSINLDIVGASNQARYFLAQSFEGALLDRFGAELNGNNLRAQLLRTSEVTSDYSREQTPAMTPWVQSQHLGALSSWSISNTKQLFRLVALDTGESGNRFKVSIEDISVPTGDAKLINPYCSFSVVIRHWTADAGEVVKTYSGCNLDSSSPNYIARKIGDQHYVWDHSSGRMEKRGLFSNKDSQFRVEVSPEVASGAASPELVPASYYGPSVLRSVAAGLESRDAKSVSATMRLRKSSVGFNRGEPQSSALFGIDTNLRSNGLPTDKPDASYVDLTKPLHVGAATVPGFVFSLELLKAGIENPASPGNAAEDLLGNVVDEDSKCFYFDLAGRSDTSNQISERGEGTFNLSAENLLVDSDGLSALCSRVGGFTLPVTGGTDGFDIREADPLCSRILAAANDSETASAPYYTMVKAISSVSDAEFIEYNILSAPGIEEKGLTDRLLQTAEGRGDALAVIDMPGIYTPATSEFRNNEAARVEDISGLVAEVKGRAYNSSYGCTYAPWILIQDGAGKPLWLPGSVAGVGTMGSSAASSEVWFAPAGFNRGGLHEGASGLSVMGVSHHLTSKQRDDLYDVCVNPIASFPSENIVIFGQKTLQGFQSALDRINVRRLLIHVKKRVSQISRGLLFEPNLDSTWLKFKLPVEEFLSTIQSGGGLTDYRVVLDSTTTTPDLIDRNVMYAKVLLKPARAIEYIAVDFVVTNTGASFDD